VVSVVDPIKRVPIRAFVFVQYAGAENRVSLNVKFRLARNLRGSKDLLAEGLYDVFVAAKCICARVQGSKD